MDEEDCNKYMMSGTATGGLEPVGQNGGKDAQASDDQSTAHQRTLYVHNVSKHAVASDLRAFFSQVGPVEQVQMKSNARGGRVAYFAFVTFKNLRHAQMAIETLSGHELHGRVIRLEYQKSPSSKPSRGGDENFKLADKSRREERKFKRQRGQNESEGRRPDSGWRQNELTSGMVSNSQKKPRDGEAPGEMQRSNPNEHAIYHESPPPNSVFHEAYQEIGNILTKLSNKRTPVPLFNLLLNSRGHVLQRAPHPDSDGFDAVSASGGNQMGQNLHRVWQGYMARNDKKKFAAAALAIFGPVQQYLSNFGDVINVTHRFKWEEVAMRPIVAGCIIEATTNDDAKHIKENIEYFKSKNRAGVAAVNLGHLYLIPPGTDLYNYYASQYDVQNSLLGLITPTGNNHPASIPQPFYAQRHEPNPQSFTPPPPSNHQSGWNPGNQPRPPIYHYQ